MKQRKTMKGRVLRSTAVSTISIALVMLVLGGIGYVMANLWQQAESARSSVTMIVELDDKLSVEQADTLAATISQRDMVASVRYVSKDEKMADEEFRRAFNVDIEALLGENPLPNSLDVVLSASSADSVALHKFIDDCSALTGVTHISYPEKVLEEVHSVMGTMQLLMMIFGGAMLLISLVLLQNTVRLNIFSHRETIDTMKAVGATKWFIMAPFLRRAAVQGLVAGILASLLLGGSLYAIDRNVAELGILSQVELLGIIAAAITLAAVVVVVIFTTLAVNKFVNMSSNKIHLY